MLLNDLSLRLLDKHSGLLKPSEYPNSIEFPRVLGLFGSSSRTWEYIKELREFSTRWEYAFTIGSVAGELLYSKIESSRDHESVRIKNHKIEVKPEYDSDSNTLIDHILIDEKNVAKMKYKGDEEIKKRNELIRSNKFSIGFVAQIHSHPEIQIPGVDKKIYTFFSRQDMLSLVQGDIPLLGLVGDRLWLAGKTTISTVPDHRELQEVTQLEINGSEREFVQLAGDTLSRHNIVLYMGRFGSSSLVKV